LLLVDVALGRSYQLAHGKFIGKEDLDDAGFHSVKCCGTKVPDPAYDAIFTEGMIAALGKEAKASVPVSELVHDEIVVYSPEQARIKYMLKLKFNFPTD
jgi:poly [ADP-ribose] polymerase